MNLMHISRTLRVEPFSPNCLYLRFRISEFRLIRWFKLFPWMRSLHLRPMALAIIHFAAECGFMNWPHSNKKPKTKFSDGQKVNGSFFDHLKWKFQRKSCHKRSTAVGEQCFCWSRTWQPVEYILDVSVFSLMANKGADVNEKSRLQRLSFVYSSDKSLLTLLWLDPFEFADRRNRFQSKQCSATQSETAR